MPVAIFLLGRIHTVLHVSDQNDAWKKNIDDIKTFFKIAENDIRDGVWTVNQTKEMFTDVDLLIKGAEALCAVSRKVIGNLKTWHAETFCRHWFRSVADVTFVSAIKSVWRIYPADVRNTIWWRKHHSLEFQVQK